MAQDHVDAGHQAGVKTDEHQELVSLRRRNRVLKMEIEILKRASAYFAREDVLPILAHQRLSIFATTRQSKPAVSTGS